MKKQLKYYVLLLIPLLSLLSMKSHGIVTFMAVFFFFILIPFIELFTTPNNSGFDRKTALQEKRKFSYSILLIIGVVLQYALLFYFLYNISSTTFLSVDYFGKISAMGLSCGILGINIGHELGHRNSRFFQLLGELSLLTSLRCHCLPYHNQVHHYTFATHNDPGTAHKNESVYAFWLRFQYMSFIASWNTEINHMKRLEKSRISLSNRIIVYAIHYVLALLFVWIQFGSGTLFAFVLAAVFGMLFTDTFTYVSHYGLRRKKTNNTYDRPSPEHSWNANHPLSLLLLLNRPRHSDHHKNSSKSYHLLLSLHKSRKLPTSYPAMMLCALFPPLWKHLMHKLL
jgi:alkane 1-monooxygenase